MSVRLRLNNWLLPALIALLLVMQILDPSRTWKTLLIGLGGAWLVGFLWARGLARGLHLVREIRYDWAQVGDRLEERFTLINESDFPATWIEIEDNSTMPDYHPSMATTSGGRSVDTHVTSGQCTRRGLYFLGDTSLQTGDPLGIYSITINDPTRRTLLVLPPVVPLPLIDVTPGGYLGEGRPRVHAPEETIRAASVREYQPGDPLRHIHWPTSAKHSKLFTRQFDGTPAGNWWILLDLDERTQVGEGWDSTEEHAVILAASLSDRGLHTKQSVGLAVNGENPAWLIPRDGEPQRWEILHALALARPGPLPLEAFLQRTGSAFGKYASLVVITASTSPGWLGALAPLQWRGIVPTVLLLDPVTFGGTGNAQGMATQCQRSGIACHVISSEVLNRPEARPGQAGTWQWRISKVTGKVETLRRPEHAEWRRLA